MMPFDAMATTAAAAAVAAELLSLLLSSSYMEEEARCEIAAQALSATRTCVGDDVR